MPGMAGLTLQEQLNERRAILPIIFITDTATCRWPSKRCRRALDFLQKPFRDQELLDHRERPRQGRGESSRASGAETGRARFAELDAARARGHGSGRAGQIEQSHRRDLDISQRTVEIHRARVMEKTQAGSLAHLVRMVLRLQETGAR